MQRQYGYRQGMLLVIDPFSIPEVRFQFEELLEPEDIAGIGRADINGIINAFLTKLREVTGLSDNKMSAVPLAVVISRIDSAGLGQLWGEHSFTQKLGNRESAYFLPAGWHKIWMMWMV